MYADRVDAGRRLAEAITNAEVADPAESVVLGLPRGGVPVAAEVASQLALPLDVLIVRKVGAPDDPEFAIGAVGEEGVVVVDAAVADRLGLTDEIVAGLVATQQQEVDSRVALLRRAIPRLALIGRTALVIDDGLATGATAAAAVGVARAYGAARVVVAAPVGSHHAVTRLESLADAVVCPAQPEWFAAVGHHYQDFRQTTDEEVTDALAAQRKGR